MNRNRTKKLSRRSRGTRKLQRGGRVVGSALKAIQGQARLITKIRKESGQKIGHGSGASFQFMTLPEDMGSIFVKMTIDEGLDDVPAAGGEFIFLLELPENFPTNPPNWFMFTEVARCDRGARLCLDPISGWHVHEWQVLKDKRTIPDMLSGFASHFMRYGGDGSHGVGWKAIQADITKEMIYPMIQAHAAASRAFNRDHFKRGEVYRFLASNIITVSGDMSAEIIAFRAELLRQSEIRPDESLMDRFCDVVVFGEQECPSEFALTVVVTTAPAVLPLQVVKINGAGAETEAFTVPPEFNWSHLDLHDGKLIMPVDFSAGDILALETIMKRKLIGANLGGGRFVYISGINQENVNRAKELLFGTHIGSLSELNVKPIDVFEINMFKIKFVNLATRDEKLVKITLPEIISKFRPDIPMEIQFEDDMIVALIVLNVDSDEETTIFENIMRNEPVFYKFLIGGRLKTILINPNVNQQKIKNFVTSMFVSNITKSIKGPHGRFFFKHGELIIELGTTENAYILNLPLNFERLEQICTIYCTHDAVIINFVPRYSTEDDVKLLHRILKGEEYIAFCYFHYYIKFAAVTGFDANQIREVMSFFYQEAFEKIPGLNRRPTTQIFIDEAGHECRLENVTFVVKNLALHSFTPEEVRWVYNSIPGLDACELIRGRPGILVYDYIKYTVDHIETLLNWGIPIVETTTPFVDHIKIHIVEKDKITNEIIVPVTSLQSMGDLVNGKYYQIIRGILLGYRENLLQLIFNDDIKENAKFNIIRYCEGRLKDITLEEDETYYKLYSSNVNDITYFFSNKRYYGKPDYTILIQKIILVDIQFNVTIFVGDTIYQEGSFSGNEYASLLGQGLGELKNIIYDSIKPMVDAIDESTKHIPCVIRAPNENVAFCCVELLSGRPIAFRLGNRTYETTDFSQDTIASAYKIMGGIIRKPLEFQALIDDDIEEFKNMDCFITYSNFEYPIRRLIEIQRLDDPPIKINFTEYITNDIGEEHEYDSDSILAEKRRKREELNEGIRNFLRFGISDIDEETKSFLFRDTDIDDYEACLRQTDYYEDYEDYEDYDDYGWDGPGRGGA